MRSNVLRLAYLPLWGSLQPGRLALELRPFPQLKRHWQHLKAKPKGAGEEKGQMERYEYDFLPTLVKMFLASVESYSYSYSFGESGEAGGRTIGQLGGREGRGGFDEGGCWGQRARGKNICLKYEGYQTNCENLETLE